MDEAANLLLKLQEIIQNKDNEIKRLKSQVYMLKAHNEQLTDERNVKKLSLVGSLSTIATTKEQSTLSPSQSPRIKQKGEAVSTTTSTTPPGTPPILGSAFRRKKRAGATRLPSEEYSFIKESTPSDSSTISTNKEEEQEEDDEEDMSVTSSDFSSTEDSSVDLDNTSTSPVPESPTSVISALPDTPKMKDLKGRRSKSSASAIGNSLKPLLIQEEETEDIDSIFLKSPTAFRQRIATFGGQGIKMKTRPKLNKMPVTNGGAAATAGQDSAPDKPAKLRRRNTYPLRGQLSSMYDINFLSPDMEMKIHEMTQMALGRKYGGKEKATKAAIVIQTAYRRYKNVQHFKQLRQLQRTTMQRRRTMSVKFPGGRRPSMINRKSKTAIKSVDKMAQVKTIYRNITQPRLSPNISRRELLSSPLATTTTSPLTIQEKVSIKMEDRLESIPIGQAVENNIIPNQLSMIDEMEGDDDGEKTELETTYSEERTSDHPRSHSIFSGISSSTIQKMFSASHPIIIQQRESASTLRKKTIIGANIFNRNPKRGIQYLVFEGVLEDNPYAVAEFLKSYYAISKEKIGEFVGEIRLEFNMAVLECLVESIDLSDKTIDEAIRDFQKLFRMPGEAQKIDKIMQVFASEYYKHNQENIVKSEDAAYVLSFAIMMLHTDTHNPSVKRHMTREEWINMNRGTNDDEDFPKSFLLSIYDRIQLKEFETGKDHTHQVSEIRKKIFGHGIPPLANPQRRFIHQCEVLQVKDMHKRNLRRNRRILFLFNDVVLVTKKISEEKFEFRKAFTLLNSQAMNFTSQYYKYGVYLQHEMSGETYYCNCDSEGDRTRLLTRLTDVMQELREMENERISDFAYKGNNKVSLQKGSSTMKNAECMSGDLISSIKLSSSDQNLRSVSNNQTDFKRKSKTISKKDTSKRTSKDSGFDSPQMSPTPYMSSTLPNNTHHHLLSPTIEHNGVSRMRSLSPDSARIHSPERKRMTVVPSSNNTNSNSKDSNKNKRKLKIDTAKANTLNPSKIMYSPISSPKKNKSSNRMSVPIATELLKQDSLKRSDTS